MLRIRLSRGGARKSPYYHVVVSDARAPRDSKYIEQLGHFNPLLDRDDPKRVGLVEDRIRYWLSQGAKPSDRVQRFLAAANLYEARKIPKQTKKNLPSEKTLERVKAREEKLAAKSAAPAPAAEEAAPVAAAAEETAATPAPEAAAPEAAPAEAAAPEATPAEAAPAEAAAPEATSAEAAAPEADAKEAATEASTEASTATTKE